MASRDDWQRRLGPLYGGAVALVHSTPWRWPSEVGDDPRAGGWLVALGVPVGGLAWLAAALAQAAGLSVGVAAVVGLAALALGSAALIERGLADRVDQWERPRSGAWAGQPAGLGAAAVLVLVFVALARAAALVALPPGRWLAVLVATAVVGRWAAMFVQALGDPIHDDDGRRSLVAAPTPAWLAAAITGGVGVLAIAALGKIGLVALALAALAAFGLGLHAQRRDGGLSAPAVASVAAVGELAVLVLASLG